MIIKNKTEKKCCTCKVIKPITHYYKYARAKDGYNWRCKLCYKPNSISPIVADKVGCPKGYKGNTPINLLELRHPKIKPSFIHNMYRMASMRSASKRQEFTITKDDLCNLINNFCDNNYYSISSKDPFQPSIDRLDNSKGYTLNNIRICWLIENYCKNTFNNESVIEFCKRKLGIII